MEQVTVTEDENTRVVGFHVRLHLGQSPTFEWDSIGLVPLPGGSPGTQRDLLDVTVSDSHTLSPDLIPISAICYRAGQPLRDTGPTEERTLRHCKNTHSTPL